jgi:hypothetical protein
MTEAIVDLASARGRQSLYVMLSRVKTFEGLAVLRKFSPKKLEGRMSQELREEFERLDTIAVITRDTFVENLAHNTST